MEVDDPAAARNESSLEQTIDAEGNLQVTAVEKPLEEASYYDKAVEMEEITSSEQQDDFIKTAKAEKIDDDTEDPKAHLYSKFPMREFVLPMGGTSKIKFNWFTSLFAICFLWGLAIWCMVNPDQANPALVNARGKITDMFTWFYVGTNPAFMFFMIWLAFRYGHVRLGPHDSKPEFDDVTYFAMLFSAGIGVGLFFFGVSEPLFHQASHWYAAAGYHAQDEVDMWALNLTVFHWGLTGWSQYLLVAVCAGLASYRFGLPMTMRSCFYPLIGEYTWGWIGDVIDGYTMVTTVAGVCTSLGLGAFQITAGLQRLGVVDEVLTDQGERRVQLIIIWIVTFIATISVVSGLTVGIKFLSQFGFGLGMLLLFLVFVMENTFYILNLIVQETGFYLQWSIFQLNFWTGAFGQLSTGEGRAIDGQAAADWWMNSWTIFYIGWWVAWAAFVGLFIARISRGRTIRSVIVWSYLTPISYTILWFGVFGGVGLRQSRQAQEMKVLGEEAFNDTTYFQVSEKQFNCYNVPQQDVVNQSDPSQVLFTNTLPGITPVCEFNSADSDNAWFNVLFSFSYPNDLTVGFGYFLSWLSLVAVAIYFVTSSDSGSLIVDELGSNGDAHTHWTQRVFWAVTEGAVATGLLVAGGRDALGALQAASILSGLPFTAFLIFMSMTIWSMCIRAEANDEALQNGGQVLTLKQEWERKGKFTMPVFGGIFNIGEWLISLGNVHPERVERGMDAPTHQQCAEFFLGLVVPFVGLYKVLMQLRPKPGQYLENCAWSGLFALLHFAWIALFACGPTVSIGFYGFAFSAFFANALILCNVRLMVRQQFNIHGNLVADFILSAFVYPQVVTQLLLHFQDAGVSKTTIEEVTV